MPEQRQLAPTLLSRTARFVPRWDGIAADSPAIIVDTGGGIWLGASGECPMPAQGPEVLPFGAWDGLPLGLQAVPEAQAEALAAAGLVRHAVRELAASGDERAGLFGYAAQVADFASTHQFCGRCGSPTQPRTYELARTCPACGLTSYPRVAPAVMVLVTRGGGEALELLLARGPRHRPGMYSALAGFVEPSETLEECARREVAEEVGVQIEGLNYQMSQPWPFPHSLMVAFTARYAGGEIVPQKGEIEDARWFSARHLPQLPPRISVAHALITAAVHRCLGA